MTKKCIVCGREFEGKANSRYCSESCRNKKIKTSDHIGEKHYELKIVSAYRQKSILYANCICSCGKKCTVRYDLLLSGNVKSCGHLSKENKLKPSELKGIENEFGIIALENTGKKRNGSYLWKCRCTCGKIFETESQNFKKIKSCGHLSIESAKKHAENDLRELVDAATIDGTNIYAISDKKLLKNNKSGVRGVCWDKSREKWIAQIQFKGKHYNLGRYDKKEDAIAIRKIAEKNMHVNFIEWFKKNYPDKWEKIKKNEAKK